MPTDPGIDLIGAIAPTLGDLVQRRARLRVTCAACGGIGYPILEKVASRIGPATRLDGRVVIACRHCASPRTSVAVEG